MTPTLAEARAEVHRILDVPLTTVRSVYDHEPAGEADGPVYVTVTLARLTPTAIVEAVRIYSQVADSPTNGAAALETAIEEVDDLLKAEQIGPSDWDTGLNDELQCLVARCFVEIPRETF